MTYYEQIAQKAQLGDLNNLRQDLYSRDKTINDFRSITQQIPNFVANTPVNRATGELEDQYKLGSQQSVLPQLRSDLGGIDLSSLQSLRQRATGNAPSQYAQLQEQAQRREEQGALENLSSQGAASQSQAFSNLAASGGAASGARERIARGSGLDQLLEQQRIARAGEQSRTGIRAEDERQRLGIQQNLANRSTNVAQLLGGQAQLEQDRSTSRDQYNLGTTLSGLNALNQERMLNRDQLIKNKELMNNKRIAENQATALRQNA